MKKVLFVAVLFAGGLLTSCGDSYETAETREDVEVMENETTPGSEIDEIEVEDPEALGTEPLEVERDTEIGSDEVEVE